MKKRIVQFLTPYLYHRAFSRALFSLYGLVIQELRVLPYQFTSLRYPLHGLVNGTRQCLTTMFRLFQGRSTKLSFSYHGEDRIIEDILKPIVTQKGFYVDVGSNHPVFHSNSFLFYKRGWKGICIDPNQRLIKKYAGLRPRDTAVCALVSDETNERSFYQFTNDVLSTTERHNIDHHTDLGQEVSESKMTPRTLTEILTTNGAPAKFDFLTIDAEEHDFNVIKSLDFELFRPKLIITELEDFPIDMPEENEVYQYLTERGYTLSGFVLKNAYFVLSNEH